MNCPKCNGWMKLINIIMLEDFIAYKTLWVCMKCNVRVKNFIRAGGGNQNRK